MGAKHIRSRRDCGDAVMPNMRDWMDNIKLNRGEIGGTINGNPSTDMIDGCWFYRWLGDSDKKPIRDRVAREMRKDGWTVKTETNSLGWFFRATRKKEE